VIEPITCAVNTPRNDPPVESVFTPPWNDALQPALDAKMLTVLPIPATDHAPALTTPPMLTIPSVYR
jgi:hypothetical protein